MEGINVCTHVHLHSSICIIYVAHVVHEDTLRQMYVDAVRLTHRS